MTQSILSACAINGATLMLLLLSRHYISRRPLPGLWWLTAIVLATMLTLKVGGTMLS